MFLFKLFGHIILFIAVLFFSPEQVRDKVNPMDSIIRDYPFEQGEKIYYKMNYSIFTVGKAEISIYPLTYIIHDKKCFKIDIYGRTAGAAAVVSTVNDTWGGYIDEESLLPVKAWRHLEEGRYRRTEYVDYHQDEGQVDVHVINKETGKLNKPLSYNFTEPSVMDLVSGYIYLRTLDFDNILIGDTIQLHSFLEDKFYKFDIMYKGTEEIKTKLGRILAHKLVPVMPDNSIFAGENSITAWIAADDSKIPLVVEANMFIGKASCEISGFEGTKKSPIFIKD